MTDAPTGVIVALLRELAKRCVVDPEVVESTDMVGVHLSFDPAECEGLLRFWVDEPGRIHVVARWKADAKPADTAVDEEDPELWQPDLVSKMGG